MELPDFQECLGMQRGVVWDALVVVDDSLLALDFQITRQV
jgi:hypothetical protein